MENFGALISAFITIVLVLLFMNVSAYFAAKYASDKEKNLNPNFNNLTQKEKVFNFMNRISKTPTASSIFIGSLVFVAVFFERQ